MLTAVTARPAKLIRRLPNRLIRMRTDYVVYDAQVQGSRRAQEDPLEGLWQGFDGEFREDLVEATGP